MSDKNQIQETNLVQQPGESKKAFKKRIKMEAAAKKKAAKKAEREKQEKLNPKKKKKIV